MNNSSAIWVDTNLIIVCSFVFLTFAVLVTCALLCVCIAYNCHTKILYKKLETIEKEKERISHDYKAKIEDLEDTIRADLGEINDQEREINQMNEVIKKDTTFADMLMAYDLYEECSPVIYMLFNKVCYDFSENRDETFLSSIDSAITYMKTVPVSQKMVPLYRMIKECYEHVPDSHRVLKNNDIKEINSMMYKAEHDC